MTNKEFKDMTDEEFKNMTDKEFKDLLINDMIEILKSDEISKYSKEHILDMYCWVLTERKMPYSFSSNSTKSAKFKGCKYWSKKAFENIKNVNVLRHEHVVPRKSFKKYINKIIWDSVDKDELRRQIKKCFIGCVVHKDEAKRLDDAGYKQSMPKDEKLKEIEFEEIKNPWGRYIKTNEENDEKNQIKICEIEWSNDLRGWKEKSNNEIDIHKQ